MLKNRIFTSMKLFKVLSVGLSMIRNLIFLKLMSDGPGRTRGEIIEEMLSFCFIVKSRRDEKRLKTIFMKKNGESIY